MTDTNAPLSDAELREAVPYFEGEEACTNAPYRIGARLLGEVRRLRAENAAWAETAQLVVDLFDPMKPPASSAVLRMVALGLKAANAYLRTENAALRKDLGDALDAYASVEPDDHEGHLAEVRRLRAEIAALRKGQCDCEHCVCHREHERPCHCMNDE